MKALIGWILITGMTCSAQNLLLNPSFEAPVADGSEPTPDNWGFFTSTPNSSGVVSSEFARTGGQVLQFFTPEATEFNGSFQGYFQNTSISLAVSNNIVFSLYVRSSPFLPFETNAVGKMGIEFRLGATEIYRQELTWQPSDLSTEAWTLFTINTFNTSAVDNLTFTIVEVNGGGTNANGIFWVDDASATIVPEPSALVLALLGSVCLLAVRRRKAANRIILLMAVGLLAAGNLPATLIQNGSFESPIADGSEPAPSDWNFFTSGPNSSGVVSSEFARTGGQVLQFYAPPDPGDVGSFQGYFQTANLSLSVSNQIVYSVWIRSSPFFPLETNATGKIGIEFRKNNSEIYREELAFTPSQISTGAWQLFTISTFNTAAVDQLNFTIVQVNGGTLPNSGIFWVEDAQAFVVPEPSLLGLLVVGGLVMRAAHRRRSKRTQA